MPVIVSPPSRWMWEHAPPELKHCFFFASGCTLLTFLISLLHNCSMRSKGRALADKNRHIQLAPYVQKNLSIVSKTAFLSFFAWLSLVVMPFARVYDIIISVVLALVVKNFADLCIGHLHNSTQYFEAVEELPKKWWASPPFCCFGCLVSSEKLQLKHLKRANFFVSLYVLFIPVDAFLTMIRDTAFTPPIALDPTTGYCDAATTVTHAPYNPHGWTTLAITIMGMWGVGIIATSVDMCLGVKAGAMSQLYFIRMYQLIGLLKGLVGHWTRRITFLTPTYPVAAIINFAEIANAPGNSTIVPVSTVVDCPVFDNDVMSRGVFLTFCCFWLLLIAIGNRTRFTLEHEEDVMELEDNVAEKLRQGLLHYTKAPTIHETLG